MIIIIGSRQACHWTVAENFPDRENKREMGVGETGPGVGF